MIYRSNFGKYVKEKKEKEKWHKWFSWYPVTLETHEDGSKTKAWLTYVLRKKEFLNKEVKFYYDWKYKMYEKPKGEI